MLMLRLAAIALALFLFAAYASADSAGGSLALQCSSSLDSGYKELKAAEAAGFRGAIGLTKAASLLAAAKVQYEFKRYPNCIDKVRRARIHIAQARER